MVVKGSFERSDGFVMYEVDRVSAMIAGKRALIPIIKGFGKTEEEGKELMKK